MRIPEIAFRLCGVAGLLLGAPLAISLALHRGLSPWKEAVLIAVAVGALLATPLAVKVFTGVDGFVFYRDVICIFTVVWVTLRCLHQPVLPYLDVTLAGAGVFHAWGRLGCLLSGCCFGRPWKAGVRYGHAHAEMGFPEQLVGVRLFPIQAVESAWIACLAASAAFLIYRHSLPGAGFAFYVCGYACGRFCFEFARGDKDRPYWKGFSQAQWISLLLTLGISAAEFSGRLPRSKWSAFAFVPLALAMLLLGIARQFWTRDRFELFRSSHVQELAQALRRLQLSPEASAALPRWTRTAVTVSQTSLGLRLSAGQLNDGGSRLQHYSLSREGRPLSLRNTRLLARQISRLQHNCADFQVAEGHHGVMHVFFRFLSSGTLHVRN
jgi:Prolipoprotein diacylglyceryl transferase